MPTSDLITAFVRLVIFAAGVAAIPIVYRSGGRRRTYAIIIIGLVSVSIPASLQIVQHLSGAVFGPTLSALSQLRMEEPGYATILVGLLLGLRDLRRFRDQLNVEYQTLKREASTDYLTGLLSRRQAELLLEFGAARAQRSKSPLGFVMIDLDHFKEINDTHGHQAGDAVLAHVGKLLKNRLRASDIVSRYGGEEFLVVVLDASPGTLLPLAENLRDMIEKQPARHGKLDIPIHASFGVALCQIDSDDGVKDAISKADQALYAAKTRGRNQVVSWSEIAPAVRESAASAAEKN
ncbi:MAG: GGDEF domain-containing protein [Planctomycetota bacterium]|nr:GGDEF domain-containing protein [Planctomycetota bacterium]